MNKTFFIADTHFGHEAIINYENRPFKNSKEMTATLISNWNSVISNEDTVFVLGDFSAYDKDTNISICKSKMVTKSLLWEITIWKVKNSIMNVDLKAYANIL